MACDRGVLFCCVQFMHAVIGDWRVRVMMALRCSRLVFLGVYTCFAFVCVSLRVYDPCVFRYTTVVDKTSPDYEGDIFSLRKAQTLYYRGVSASIYIMNVICFDCVRMLMLGSSTPAESVEEGGGN